MKLRKADIKKIIREEKIRLIMEQMEDVETDSAALDHYYPRVEWDTKVGELVDKWTDMELKTFDAGDPSMTQDGELSQAEAKSYWAEQVDAASMDLENELVMEIRKVALAAMKSVSNKLMNGEYS